MSSQQKARSDSKSGSRKKRVALFPAMFTMAQMYDLEATLQEVDSHAPRRIALAIFAKDSEQLIRRFGASNRAAALLPEQLAAVEHYLAAQLDFVAMLGVARDRIFLTTRRIAAAHPEFASVRTAVSRSGIGSAG